MMHFRHRHVPLLFASLVMLAACSAPSRYQMRHDRGPDDPVDVSQVADAVPRNEPRSKYGNPASYEVNGKRYHVLQSGQGYVMKGVASWYGKKFHGHRTSSGETYNMYAMTAAHKTLPLPSYVRVTHLGNQRSVIVKVNDRGPFHADRVIDLSYAAAKKLGIVATGTGMVKVEVIDPAHPQQAARNDEQQDENRLYLQVGAFASRYNATRLSKRLQGMFDPRRIVTDFLQEKNLYRVRIGPLASVAEADRFAAVIIDKGISEPHIVID